MGRINARLAQMYDTVRPEVALSVIVRTKEAVNPMTMAAARAVGAGPITYAGRIDHSYGTTATQAVAERLAQLPQTSEVFPDEPTYLV